MATQQARKRARVLGRNVVDPRMHDAPILDHCPWVAHDGALGAVPPVAAAGREPQRAAPVPLVLTPVALVLVAARQARDATPRAHAACKPAVVPLAVDADVAAAAVWPQRVVELA